MQEPAVRPVPTPARPVSPGPLYGLRVLVTAQVVALAVTASFAGQAVQGQAGLGAHVTAGLVVNLLALLQTVAATLVWRPGRGTRWAAPVSACLFLAGLGQHLTPGTPAAHVPAGLALLGLGVAVLVWAWSPRAAVRHS